MNKKLIAYSAFWHSDKSWGFGATLYRVEDDEFFQTFYDEAEKLGTNLHLDSTMTVEEYRAQLKGLARDYKNIGDLDNASQKVGLLMLMFGNLKFLTLREAIPNNDFNGLQYAYEHS
ncbi:MAG: hypothetical protein II336_15360 [Loktanella sp.]|nr:hypothetical protein [Loktanella sp.]